MEDQVEERSPIVIAVGIGGLILALLVVLGLLARTQMPVEAVNAERITESESQSAAPEVDDAQVTDAITESRQAESSQALSSAESASASETATGEDATNAESAVTEASHSDDQSAVALTQEELEAAFAAGGCSSCHMIPNITGAVGQLGPDLTYIGSVAATRIEGMSAEDYIRQSLADPEAYIVEDCPTGPCIPKVMQASNIALVSETEAEGIISYMLSLTDGKSELAAATDAGEEPTQDETEVEEPEVDETEVEEPEVEEPTLVEPVAEPAPEKDATVDMAAVSTAIAKGTCAACHVIPGIDGAVGVLGPDLSGIGTTGATRIDGYTATEYLYESIVDPNAFIAPQCPTGDCLANVMLPNLVDLLTADEIDTIVGYLRSLEEGG